MAESVWPVDGLLSVSQGLTEGDTEVAGPCPSVFLYAATLVCARVCI